jgi:hypothetical protein
MSNKKYDPAADLHAQEANRLAKNKYNPRTAGEFWNSINIKIEVGDNVFDRLRTRYKSNAATPLFISRSKIEIFLKCPRCFYFIMKYGFRRPQPLELSLNKLVDTCCKNDMDYCRKHDVIHPIFEENSVELKPYIPDNPQTVKEWRDDMKAYIGAYYLYEKYNWLLCGIVDDIMVNENGGLVVIDFKSTSKFEDINSFDDVSFGAGLKVQLEWYSWLFLQMGFEVENTAYLIYYNAVKDKHLQPDEDFSLMRFRRTLVPVECELDWIEPTLEKMYQCLESSTPPEQQSYQDKYKERNKCDQCAYLNMYEELNR